MSSAKNPFNRRTFVAVGVSGSLAATLAKGDEQRPITQASVPGDPAAPKEQQGTVAATDPFTASLSFTRHDLRVNVEPFGLAEVRLLPSAFYDAQEANRNLLHRYSADRLLHTFRLNAGLPSTAQPLGGWERPDCELRGHFTGHYLSACALMFAATGDTAIRDKGNYLVTELGKCQQKLGGGYLSAFPTELFDRLKRREKVWAPFYTYHKILAGMIDMHELCNNAQALAIAKGMADWVDAWTAQISDEQMQMVLDEEFGGMNDALYSLAGLTRTDHYATVGDRFTKRRFFNPLALRRDQLRGLHTNTHIPQVIGAARRYEISCDSRFHDVADAFWNEVVRTRTYATGGTSNNEGWLTAPNHLAEELKQGSATNECCCAYNMMKLTRHLYEWSGDPRYFDYYEQVLYNHRLGTIDTANGHTQYYLGVVPGSWRTFGTEEDSFWCCNGTGVEEYSKLAGSIYFRRKNALFVNLFMPSELDWKEQNVRVKQTNHFPEEPRTRLEFVTESPRQLAVNIRIPSWVSDIPTVSLNGKPMQASAGPGSYLAISRSWQNGDQLEVTFPMSVYARPMPDEPTLQAFLYGPLLLATTLRDDTLPESLVTGRMGPEFKNHTPAPIPEMRAGGADSSEWIRRGQGSLAFNTPASVTLVPFNTIGAGRPYSIYFKVT
ncbi:MAG: glycoside hydrolase family 127 protein [Acidobacteriaceae bacterium]|nr:glycoside hydrolase family 127 protein [Acidobacteriaceae bacterium]